MRKKYFKDIEVGGGLGSTAGGQLHPGVLRRSAPAYKVIAP